MKIFVKTCTGLYTLQVYILDDETAHLDYAYMEVFMHACIYVHMLLYVCMLILLHLQDIR